MEPQNTQPSAQPWALSDSLRQVLDTRVKSLLETLDSSKTMNAWGATPRRDSILSESSAAAEARDKTELAVSTELTASDAGDILDAPTMLGDTVTAKPAEDAASAEQETKPKAHSCTIDGACLRDLWLRGMVTAAGAALLLLF